MPPPTPAGGTEMPRMNERGTREGEAYPQHNTTNAEGG